MGFWCLSKMLIPSKRYKDFVKIISDFFTDLDNSNYWIDPVKFKTDIPNSYLNITKNIKCYNVYYFGEDNPEKPDNDHIVSYRGYYFHDIKYHKNGNQLYYIKDFCTIYKETRKDNIPVELNIINFNFGCKFILRNRKIQSDPMDYIKFHMPSYNEKYHYFSFGCPEFEEMVRNYKILL